MLLLVLYLQVLPVVPGWLWRACLLSWKCGQPCGQGTWTWHHQQGPWAWHLVL